MVPNGMQDTSKPLSLGFFINPQCPPGAVLTEAATIDVRSGEAMIALERGVPIAVLEVDISEASKHFSASEVALGNEPNSSTRVTGKSEELNVSGGSYGLYFAIAR